MELSDFLQPPHVLLGLKTRDKAQLLSEISRRAGEALTTDPQVIEAALAARERLGSTGLGSGFALPHARIPGIERFFGWFARLARPIDFQAIDDKPVDLVFLLLIPDAGGISHVGALAAISRRLRDVGVVEHRRKVHDPADAYALLTRNGAS